MDKGQKILCSVESCEYNANKDNRCSLGEIQVSPSPQQSSGTPSDETLCASYKTAGDKKKFTL